MDANKCELSLSEGCLERGEKGYNDQGSSNDQQGSQQGQGEQAKRKSFFDKWERDWSGPPNWGWP